MSLRELWLARAQASGDDHSTLRAEQPMSFVKKALLVADVFGAFDSNQRIERLLR